MGFYVLLLFYGLATSMVISGLVPTYNSVHLWQLYNGKPGHQYHDMISHSVILLSWHWATQSFPYPNNSEHLAKKWQVSVLWIIGLTRLWVQKARSPACETRALWIRPPHPVCTLWGRMSNREHLMAAILIILDSLPLTCISNAAGMGYSTSWLFDVVVIHLCHELGVDILFNLYVKLCAVCIVFYWRQCCTHRYRRVHSVHSLLKEALHPEI